jgi:hypothetical protein
MFLETNPYLNNTNATFALDEDIKPAIDTLQTFCDSQTQ